jgi:hypothetical protein
LSELRASDMGEDKIRYLLPVSGRWRWRPTRAMRARGFKLVTFGRELTATDKARAIALNAEWDQVRMGVRAAAGEQELPFPAGTVGDGYQRAMRLRALERDAKGITRTKEQTKRDDWPRGWKWLGPAFGDQDPKTVTPEELLALRRKVAERISPTEAHRVIKVWRAMWKKLQAFGYCTGKDGPRSDPSLAFSNTAPDPRQDVWHHDEVVRLVEHAWVRGNKGLAALMAVIWDSMLSPGDARMLTPGQRARDTQGAMFFLDRAKTGRAAVGTLTSWSEQILETYINDLGVDLLDNAPIFRTAGSGSGPQGGRRWLPQPYSTSKMDRDFREIRWEVFGKDEHRKLADMRRSGAVEGDAGEGTLTDQSNKMANSVAASSRLRKTYNPVNVVSARRFDEARERGRKAIEKANHPSTGEQRPTKSVIGRGSKVS